MTPLGSRFHWETLDADFSVPALLVGVFGTTAWMALIKTMTGLYSPQKALVSKRCSPDSQFCQCLFIQVFFNTSDFLDFVNAYLFRYFLILQTF